MSRINQVRQHVRLCNLNLPSFLQHVCLELCIAVYILLSLSWASVLPGAGNVQYRVTKESLMERLNTDIRAVSMSITKECRLGNYPGPYLSLAFELVN